MTPSPLMALIAGPYRSGTGDDPVLMERNLRTLESVALPLYRAGHIPLIGEWLALPLCGKQVPSGQGTRSMTIFSIPSQTGSCLVVMAFSACRELLRGRMKMSDWHSNGGSMSGTTSTTCRGAQHNPSVLRNAEADCPGKRSAPVRTLNPGHWPAFQV
jgi:hypothetical protein